MFYCKGVTKVVSSLGTLTLCMDDERLQEYTKGVIVSNPPFFFEVVKKSDPCPLRVQLLLYPFDLCLYPVNKPITLTYKKNGKYEEVVLNP